MQKYKLVFFLRKKYQKKMRKMNKKCQKLVFAMNTPHRWPKCILVFVSLPFRENTLYTVWIKS